MSAILCDIFVELNPNTIDRIMVYLILVYKVAQKLPEKLRERRLKSLNVQI